MFYTKVIYERISNRTLPYLYLLLKLFVIKIYNNKFTKNASTGYILYQGWKKKQKLPLFLDV